MNTKPKALHLIMSATMRRRTASALAAILVFAAAATTAQAAVTVTQAGGDLYVVGDAADDYVYVQAYFINQVDVADFGTYNGVENVSIDMGQGNDSVDIDAFSSSCSINVSTGNGEDVVDVDTSDCKPYGGEITIETGNAADVVELEAFGGNTVQVSTGNGEDYVSSFSRPCADFDNTITIDTGNAEDLVYLDSIGGDFIKWDDVYITLGRADDTLQAWTGWCAGTIDGGKGYDSISGKVSGYLEVTNFEEQ